MPATAEQAGSLHGLLQLMSAGPALFLAPAVRRMKDQRAVAAGAAGASCVAMIGLIVAPGWASLWIVLMGLGMGAGIILGLAFVGLRARHAQQAASLSGMAQFVGYLLAASGPLLIGALHDALGGWSAALALCAAACGDGRRRTVRRPRHPDRLVPGRRACRAGAGVSLSLLPAAAQRPIQVHQRQRYRCLGGHA